MRDAGTEALALLQERKIFLHGRINADMARRVNNALIFCAQKDERAPIKLSLHSAGGDVKPGLLLYEVIARLPCQVHAWVPSQADSIAALVLQACARRIARESARITLHETEIVLRGTVRVLRRDIAQFLAREEEEQRKMYDIVAKRTGRVVHEVEEQFKKGTPLSAREALAFGLVDEVLP